ncbi:MAG: TatD family hydrolase [Chloroflexales bacterium]|nr:TatD family hydrolase [Chloroflexales bacterium]
MANEFRLIDTHTHLHAAHFDEDRAIVLERAAVAGVARIVEIGYDLASSQAALALADDYPQIFAVVGIQPNHAVDLPPDWVDQVHSLAHHPKVVAIGEIGFDYHWNVASPQYQEQVFREQLCLARELELPVVIHSRDAQADTIRVLRDAVTRGEALPRGIMHSFSGDWAYAESCLEIGFLLSFSGPVTFPKASSLHDAACRAPLDRILTETDCPYLSPHPLRGKRNEPRNVRLITERLAELRNLSLESVASIIWNNASNIFRFCA